MGIVATTARAAAANDAAVNCVIFVNIFVYILLCPTALRSFFIIVRIRVVEALFIVMYYALLVDGFHTGKIIFSREENVAPVYDPKL